MNKEDYMSYRMITCHACRISGDDEDPDWKCMATKDDIDNCLDASAPMEEFDPF